MVKVKNKYSFDQIIDMYLNPYTIFNFKYGKNYILTKDLKYIFVSLFLCDKLFFI